MISNGEFREFSITVCNGDNACPLFVTCVTKKDLFIKKTNEINFSSELMKCITSIIASK